MFGRALALGFRSVYPKWLGWFYLDLYNFDHITCAIIGCKAILYFLNNITKEMQKTRKYIEMIQAMEGK